MKRVLQFGLSSNKGGIEVVAINILKNIDKDKVGFDFLINGKEIAFEEEIIKMGGTVHKITSSRKNPLKYYYDYIMFFKKYSSLYDSIHFSYCSLYSILPMLLSKVFKIPQIVLHARCSNYNTKRTKLKVAHNINRYISNFIATDFVTCSDLAAKFMFTRKRFVNRNYTILRNPISLEKFSYNTVVREKYRGEIEFENAFVLGHAGAFLPVKNHRFIIDVFHELIKIDSNCKLILIGEGKEKEGVKEYAETLGLKEKILFTGLIDNPNDYMQAMDVFIFPSVYEGFGNVLIEAQVAGLPCFASNTISKETKVTELVSFLSLNRTPQDWAQYIYSYSGTKNRKSMMKKIGENGFSTHESVKSYEVLYNA